MDEEITHTLKKWGELIMTTLLTGNKSLAVTLNCLGLPGVDNPLIGDDMNDGAIINEDNQANYVTSFKRYEEDCQILNLIDTEFMELSTSGDTVQVSFTKEFINTSDEAIEQYVKGISSISIADNITGSFYNAQVIGVECFDIM